MCNPRNSNKYIIMLVFLMLGGSFLFSYWFDNPSFRKNPIQNIKFDKVSDPEILGKLLYKQNYKN